MCEDYSGLLLEIGQLLPMKESRIHVKRGSLALLRISHLIVD